jgi:hypothetical protein
MATSTERTTSGTSYIVGTGSLSASMATKCMLQIPMPIATDPPRSHAARRRPWAAVTRLARSSAAYDASIAITIERMTSTGWYVPLIAVTA